MTISTKTITQSKPFYVVAGASDLAVQKLRGVPSRLSTLRVDRADIEARIAALQSETKALPAKAQTAAVTVVSEVADKADAVYGDLVSRGRSVVTRVKRQKASQDLSTSATTTVRRTKATATTAKKSASATKTSAKSTSTSAKKTAAAARKAAADGADKVGR